MQLSEGGDTACLILQARQGGRGDHSSFDATARGEHVRDNSDICSFIKCTLFGMNPMTF